MSRIEEMEAVAVQLDEWIGGRMGDNGPVAGIAYCPNGADAITIGELQVYCSEGSSYEPTFENCRDEYLRQIFEFSPLWEEASALAEREARHETVE